MRNNNVPDPSRHINDYHDEDKLCNSQINQFRPRTISEESTDSEDGYYIVFETKSNTKNGTADVDYNKTSCEDEDIKSKKKLTQKVKFNLMPIVHIMVQWDYAYRAARKGPWEEMARDRERFKRRINCIATVLDPILTSQHRAYILQERFALQK
ncbi:uncharacterized protein LOC116846821 [Odontomachus brunneus]|uniref:uncharacterized protein LOC116846821 n=1 Tax=Odontomachus brunneus TaxID=486640 RepID=UPI0013F2A182|nr:uncharacterized protein LOC116846821 [Odontomachus brunneus]XP_032677040.1 uncharacterized protein LOC116846821 [Odontomachus brunneus]XP_032677041.1 uncharacterized protein LOC116846821 [Odontomachus brunneus]XP_032677042.1 uncharacterized protein LOC116846821 [Odontomachus brunneus]